MSPQRPDTRIQFGQDCRMVKMQKAAVCPRGFFGGSNGSLHNKLCVLLPWDLKYLNPVVNSAARHQHSRGGCLDYVEKRGEWWQVAFVDSKRTVGWCEMTIMLLFTLSHFSPSLEHTYYHYKTKYKCLALPVCQEFWHATREICNYHRTLQLLSPKRNWSHWAWCRWCRAMLSEQPVAI